jgi:hypothetical protein
MNVAGIFVVVALLAGSFRALRIWRASTKVEVVNMAVLSLLARGRSEDLGALLAASGPAAYLTVARAIGKSAIGLLADDESEKNAPGKSAELQRQAHGAREQLAHDAQLAVITAARRFGREVWLDAVVLVAIGFAGVSAALGNQASGPVALGLVAATLLWLANVWGARSTTTRMYAGAMALVDSIIENLEQFRSEDESSEEAE